MCLFLCFCIALQAHRDHFVCAVIDMYLNPFTLKFWCKVRAEGDYFYFFCLVTFIPVPLSSPVFSFFSSTISSSHLLSLLSLSLGDDTKWPTRVDVSLNPNTIKNPSSRYELSNDEKNIKHQIIIIIFICIVHVRIWTGLLCYLMICVKVSG